MTELSPSPQGDPSVAPAFAPAPAPAPPSGGGIVEWFSLRRALSAANARVTERPHTTNTRIERAHAAAELAGRALDPVYPLRRGSGVSSAVSLARDAAFWALAASVPARAPSSLAEAFELAEPETVTRAAGGEARLAWVREQLLTRSLADITDASPEAQRELAIETLRFVSALLFGFEGPAHEVVMLRARRWGRLVGLLALLVVMVFGGARGVDRLRMGPDLAVGKPWRASSVYPNFLPEAHTCDGVETKILFHTKEEEDPWYEVDLGAPRVIKAVEIKNRTDGLAERAVPLVVEVSDDRIKWTEVGQRPTTFETWRATFAKRTTRYVRVRSTRRTWLHLERVSVYLARGRAREAGQPPRRQDRQEIEHEGGKGLEF